MDAVHSYEATVNQVMDDGVMALFGAPLAHEDHAVRGSYAALKMQAAVKKYAEEVHRTLGVTHTQRRVHRVGYRNPRRGTHRSGSGDHRGAFRDLPLLHSAGRAAAVASLRLRAAADRGRRADAGVDPADRVRRPDRVGSRFRHHHHIDVCVSNRHLVSRAILSGHATTGKPRGVGATAPARD